MTIKIGVIGAGVFGRYHSQKLMAHPDVDFVGLYDPDRARMKKLCEELGATLHTQVETLLNQCAGVVIACPASYHAQHAINALNDGCHILVEKPLATNVKDAQSVVALAKKKNLIVQVGHQERFVARAIGLGQVPETPLRVTAKRLGKMSTRGTDTSVTMDLMTHDIDLVLWLMNAMPRQIKGQALKIYSEHPDVSLAQLTFENASARLEASRAEDDFERVMTLVYPSGTVRIDFNTKTLEHDTPFDLNHNFVDDPSAKDSLAAGTESFVRAIKDGVPPMVSGEDGLRAVQVATEVDKI